MQKINNYSYQYPEGDQGMMAELTDPNYDGGSFTLPENPSPLEKSKYRVCQSIVTYKLTKKLNIEEIAEKIELSKAETKRLLRYRIDKFTLDRLVTYAGKLFPALELGFKETKIHESVPRVEQQSIQER